MRWRQLFAGVDEPAYVVPVPPQVGGEKRPQVPRHNVTCGYLYGDGIMCHEPAGPDHQHPRDDVGILRPVVEEAVQKAMEQPLDTAVLDGVRNPAPGLWETLTGQPLPTWQEMRRQYPALGPLKVNTVALRGAVAAAKFDQVNARVHAATDAGEVDFRHMLKDDAAAWSAKARIEKVLGRPYLATQLADQLAPDTAAALADRLESLVSQAVAETEMRLSAETSRLVTEKIAEIRATRTSPAEAVSRERFNTPSRFS